IFFLFFNENFFFSLNMTYSENQSISFQGLSNDKIQMILLIENKSDSWLGDILAKYDVKIVFSFHDLNANRVKLVTPKLIRDILRNKKLRVDCIKGSLSSFSRNEIIVK